MNWLFNNLGFLLFVGGMAILLIILCIGIWKGKL
jgi:hypothetical protein